MIRLQSIDNTLMEQHDLLVEFLKDLNFDKVAFEIQLSESVDLSMTNSMSFAGLYFFEVSTRGQNIDHWKAEFLSKWEDPKFKRQ